MGKHNGKPGGAWRFPNHDAIRLYIQRATLEPSSRSISGLKVIVFSSLTVAYHMLLPWSPKAWEGNYISLVFFSSKYNKIQTNQLLKSSCFICHFIMRNADNMYDFHTKNSVPIVT